MEPAVVNEAPAERAATSMSALLAGLVLIVGTIVFLWFAPGAYQIYKALHVVAIPLVLLGLVAAHILALHDVGSNNPDGVDIKKVKDKNGHPVDGIPFHPYYTVKDFAGAVVFLFIFCFVMFFVPASAKSW